MKTKIFNQKNVCALLGVMLALTIVMSANAQGGMMADKNFSGAAAMTMQADEASENVSEILNFEEFVVEIEELATVTFINKEGEVVAVLTGDKSVLAEIYKDKMSKSYYMSSYGIHDVYLIK